MKLGNKTNSVLSLFACVLCATFLFSCAGASNAQMETEKPMLVTLKILNLSEKSPVSVELEFTLKNDTANAYEVLTWGTPFEGEINDNMFDVTKDGQPLPYLGPQLKRGAPQKEDFVEISPQGELSATLLLEKAYAITGPGLYTVQYRKPYISVNSNQGEMQLVPVVSDRIEFKIEN